MRRRVAVASALIGHPQLVLLDEPTAGLDPVEAQSLRELLVKRPKGQTVVISSHHLDEIERICDWVVMIQNGKCIQQGPLSDVVGRGERIIWRLSGAAPLTALQQALPDHLFLIEGEDLHQRAPSAAGLDEATLRVMQILLEHQVAVREVRRGISLEEHFFQRRA